MCERVALTAWAKSSLESISVPSRSKISRSMLRGRGPLTARVAGTGRRFTPRTRARAAQFVRHHLTLQCIAMNAELLGSRALVAVIARQGALDHASFENLDGLLQEEFAV